MNILDLAMKLHVSFTRNTPHETSNANTDRTDMLSDRERKSRWLAILQFSCALAFDWTAAQN